MKHFSRFFPHLFFIITTLVIFNFTKDIRFFPYGRTLEIVMFGMLLFCAFIIKKGINVEENVRQVFYLLSVSILLLVGITGWMNSSFAFLLYLLVLIVSLVFPYAVAVVFLGVLILLFSITISPSQFAFDSLRILSFLTILPISFYVRKEYLKLKQAHKEILILREEQKKKGGHVEKLLQNKIIALGATLRESVNDIKQVAYLLKERSGDEGSIKKFEEIIALSDSAIKKVNEFETTSTGEEIAKSATPSLSTNS